MEAMAAGVILLLDRCLPRQWQRATTVLLALLPVLLFLFARRRRRTGWSRKEEERPAINLPPGPPRLPILGNLHQIMGALPHQSLRDLARRHGPVMLLRLGSVPALVVSSAEAAREVMRTHDADCCSRPDTPGPRRLSYDHKDVAFAPYSAYWREMRKLFVVELLSSRRVQATSRAREAEVDKLVHRLITTSAGGRHQVRLEDHIFGLMDGVVGTVALGNIYGAERFPHRDHFHHVIDEAVRAKASFSAEDYFPNAVGRLVDRLTGVASRREQVFRDLDAFFDVVIDQHLVDPASRADSNNGGPDLIDVMVGLMNDSSNHQQVLHQEPGSRRSPVVSFTRDNVKGLLSNVFTASVDTSSVTMVWAMAELMKKPHLLRKVQREIRAAVGDDKDRVHPDDMPKLTYLRNVVKETLRLHPAAPLLLPRETLRDVRICGYDVPAWTRVFVNAWAIGRDPATWGDNPDEFDPDRFQGSDVDFNGTHFQLIPFGAGRRMCPGMAMGVATTEFTLANLLHCFDWELPEGITTDDLSLEEAGGLTIHKKVPLMVVPKRYNKSPKPA